jgi:hypothetical protein
MGIVSDPQRAIAKQQHHLWLLQRRQRTIAPQSPAGHFEHQQQIGVHAADVANILNPRTLEHLQRLLQIHHQ